MGTTKIKSEIKEVKVKGRIVVHDLYEEKELKKFKPAVLGLGNIGQKSRRIDVMAAVFDLTGFTDFCCQVDPHLSMPIFLKEFLNWLFKDTISKIEEERFKEGIKLYSSLPFFAKFTGDGVLFLWDTKDMNNTRICNMVVLLSNTCIDYKEVFVPKMKEHLSHIPESLRCGIACGTVCSVGNGEDFVGPCINIATRLQKLSNLGFCISKRGIDFKKGMLKQTAKLYMVKSVPLRGIGEDELVILRQWEFEELPEEQKKLFKDV